MRSVLSFTEAQVDRPSNKPSPAMPAARVLIRVYAQEIVSLSMINVHCPELASCPVYLLLPIPQLYSLSQGVYMLKTLPFRTSAYSSHLHFIQILEIFMFCRKSWLRFWLWLHWVHRWIWRESTSPDVGSSGPWTFCVLVSSLSLEQMPWLKGTREGRVFFLQLTSHCASLKEVRVGTWNRNHGCMLPAGLLTDSWLAGFLYIAQDHLPREGAAHIWLDFTSVSNQDTSLHKAHRAL